MTYIIIVLIAYLLGSFCASIPLSKRVYGGDVREKGEQQCRRDKYGSRLRHEGRNCNIYARRGENRSRNADRCGHRR